MTPPRASLFALLAGLALSRALSAQDPRAYDPLAYARARGLAVENLEAVIPPQCYTATEGRSNPCWTCHTVGAGSNQWVDYDLQQEYAFSDFGLVNRWSNLFVDRSAAVAAISDTQIQEYLDGDNYAPLRAALEGRADYTGYRPDLDLAQGFDELGFARDGSGWRALRYKPFPGTFWPTNGNTDDVFLRLPAAFRQRDGQESRELYRLNLSLLEAALAGIPGQPLRRQVEPVDERLLGFDLDGDGELRAGTEWIVHLPPHFAGDAQRIELEPYVHPAGVEYLHSVRYVDPARDNLAAPRMKELRYSRKERRIDAWGLNYRYERELNAKIEGQTPQYAGSHENGLINEFGWQLQGFIEDAEGRLRLQSTEETRACMGCHGSIGVTADQTFTLPRKLPGLAGWAHQDLRGMRDVPQAGHAEPEVLTYLRRVGGGDEFRANGEMLDRFFDAEGAVREELVRQAAPGGARDLRWLLAPSRERALELAKAYRALVQEQRFEFGRDVVVGANERIHRRIENGSTELEASGLVFHDGSLWLDWGGDR
jgi:hypothetical protein